MGNKIHRTLLLLFPVILSFFCGCATVPGTLNVTSTPPGATIWLDHQYRGTTPLVLADVPPGNHTLEISLDGFEDWITSGTLACGDYVEIKATLVPVPVPEPVPVTRPPAR